MNERLARITAAVSYDNGLAVQMAGYTNEDVAWLVQALGAAVRRADAAEAETTRVSLAFAEWVNISTNEMTAERAKIRELHREVWSSPDRPHWSDECGAGYDWPCPTVALLDEGRATE